MDSEGWLPGVAEDKRNSGKDARGVLTGVRTETPDGIFDWGLDASFSSCAASCQNHWCPNYREIIAQGLRLCGAISSSGLACGCHNKSNHWVPHRWTERRPD